MRYLLILSLFLCLGACISFPENNEEFVAIQQLNSLDGCYQNTAIPVEGRNTLYLSRFIWKDLQEYEHFNLKTIKLKADHDSIVVTGLLENKEKHIASWHINNEFLIRDGKLSLSRKFVYPDVLAGLAWESREIGLDTADNLRHRFEERIVGLIYFLFPMLVWLVEEDVFEKISCPSELQ